MYLLEENKVEKLRAVIGLLSQIESEARKGITEHRGSHEFSPTRVRDVFTDKILRFDKRNPLALEDPQFETIIAGRDWYVFNALYGTGEEKSFVRMLDRQMEQLREKYEAVYLVRNEGHFRVHNFTDGHAFEPDFVLFLRQKAGKLLTFQVFIEPKGKHLKEHDTWKEQFLKDIREQFVGKILTLNADAKYRLVGVPFFNAENENEFRETLLDSLN